jgi:hypothetical protein
LAVLGWVASSHAARSETKPDSTTVESVAKADAPVIREEDLLLFAVELDALTLTDSLAAYGAPEDPLLPLGELVRLLDLNLDVSPATRRITGRLGEAQRPVTVDLDTYTARVAARIVPLSKDDVAITSSEIYLRASAVQRLLPVTLAIDTEALQIKITALEPLPIQERQERIARARSLGAMPETGEEMLTIPSPYRLWSAPAFDLALETGAGAGTSAVRRYDLRVGGDILYTGFQGYAGSDEKGDLTSVRATVERHQVGGGLLGPINATSFTLGDVFTPNQPIGARSGGGRGFAFTTAPLEQTSVFDRIDLRGDLPPGYDVELYVNDILRSGQRTPVQGRYEFLGVPLVRGVNIIRIVTYGQRGERSETTRVFNVSGGQMKAHQTVFEFGVVQQDRPLIGVRTNSFEPTLPTAVPAGGLRAVANLTHGLTSTLTVVAGVALYPVAANDDRQAYSLGLRGTVFGLSTQVDTAVDARGGEALALGLAGQPLGVSIVGRHSEYRGGFIDETYPTGDLDNSLRSHTDLSLDGTVMLGKRAVPLSSSLQHNIYTNGATNLLVSSRASATVANVLVSGGLDYERARDAAIGVRQRLQGVFSASKFANYTWQLRGTLNYSLMPTLQLDSLSLTADRELSERVSLRLGVGQGLGTSRATNLQAGAVYRTRFGDLSLSSDYTPQSSDWRIGLRFAFGLVYDPNARRYGFSRPGVATGGSVAFQAFVDRDGDGVFKTGDEPTPKVVVDVGEKKIVTDANGRAFATGLGAAAIARLRVGIDDIENSYVQSPPLTVQYAPRAGQVVRIPYPLVPTGEVVAVVSVRRPEGKLVGVSAVRVRLVRDGAPPIEGSTEFDGSASFEHLPVGAYRFELDPQQAARLRMRLKSPVTFTVKADGGSLPDLAAEVVFDPAPEDPAPASIPSPSAKP